ncbi:translation initiation factor IF-3 [Candidatus Mycoplasma haematolamae str. Purdue]|uniref:Translation initiation factor IF-3 n=1 Tax=Mycoplasma haematolamae (strain Purdue) TaxID=1212765 RepID=I7CEL5_MYCHA|nr:translation initiation factor IF-3 [Candidatus Mycoplasma haematolamae str. Purdue]
MKLKIDSHDLEWKIKKAKQWLAGGERVQLLIKAPFDESETKLKAANALFEKFCESVQDVGKAIESLRSVNPSQYCCTFAPDFKKQEEAAKKAS